MHCSHISCLTGEVHQDEGKIIHEEQQANSWLERWMVLGGWHGESSEMEQVPWFKTVCCWTYIFKFYHFLGFVNMCLIKLYLFILNLEHSDKHCRNNLANCHSLDEPLVHFPRKKIEGAIKVCMADEKNLVRRNIQIHTWSEPSTFQT